MSDIPANRWELSAPESFVLLGGQKSDGAQALKLALLELVARGALRLTNVEERGAFGRKKKTGVFSPGDRPLRSNAGALARVLALFGSLPRHATGGVEGVTVADLAKAVRGQYNPLSKFVEHEVMPVLVGRGFYTKEDYKVLMIFPASRYVLTPTGQVAKDELERTTALGKQEMGRWMDSDPARALAFVGLAGSAVLLMDPVFGDLERLRQAQQTGDASGATFSYPGDDRDQLDTSDLSLDFDFSAFDSLDSAFDSIDAGVDSGAGDGGGDGGNGGGD